MASATTTAATTTTTAGGMSITQAVQEKFSGQNQPLSIMTSLQLLISTGMMIVGPWLGALALQYVDSTAKALAGAVIAFSVIGFLLAVGIIVTLFTTGCKMPPRKVTTVA